MLEELIFSPESEWDQPITKDAFPQSLKKIIFGKLFNQSLSGLLPNNLKHLEFVPNSRFNRSLDNLPSSVEILVLGYDFDSSLDNLPSSLTQLSFPPIQKTWDRYRKNRRRRWNWWYRRQMRTEGIFDQNVSTLPQTLKQFDLSGDFNHDLLSLPLSITLKLELPEFTSSLELPQNLIKLHLDCSFETRTRSFKNAEFILPDTITECIFGESFDGNISHFPRDLKKLIFVRSSLFNSALSNSLKECNQLKLVQFGELFDQTIKGLLPDSITSLTFGRKFNQHIDYFTKEFKKINI